MLSPMPFTRISPLENSTNKWLELTPNENIDLEELEEFAKEFKQRRIKLGSLKLFNLLEKVMFVQTKNNFFDEFVIKWP